MLAGYELGGHNYITPKLSDVDLMAIADGVENDENIEELAFDYEW